MCQDYNTGQCDQPAYCNTMASGMSSTSQAYAGAIAWVVMICAYEAFKYCLRRVVVTMSGDEYFSIPQGSLEAGHMLANSIVSRQLAK